MDNSKLDISSGEGQKGNNQQSMDPKTAQFLDELVKEKHSLDISSHPNAARFLDEEIQRIKETNRPSKDFRYADVYRDKACKVAAKVLVPVRDFPKFNFVGKLLGPKGNTLKRLQEETLCKMAILGRGSMRDRQKEDELRQGSDPKFCHLSDDLHVEISTLAAPAEAHARMAYALAEIRKYLVPDSNDEISHQQLAEMGKYKGDDYEGPPGRRPSGGRGGGPRNMGRGGQSNRQSIPGGYSSHKGPASFNKPPPPPCDEMGDEDYYETPVYTSGNPDENPSVKWENEGNMGGHYVAGDVDPPLCGGMGGYSSVSGNHGPGVGGGPGIDDASRGRWKQPAGNSRFAPRSVPYTRRP